MGGGCYNNLINDDNDDDDCRIPVSLGNAGIKTTPVVSLNNILCWVYHGVVSSSSRFYFTAVSLIQYICSSYAKGTDIIIHKSCDKYLVYKPIPKV